MNLLVFGAANQIGTQVIKLALAKGYTVTAFDRNVESLIDKDLHNENFKAYKGYVFDEGDIKKALKGCSAVISCLGGDISGLDKTRSLGMKNIVTQMEKVGVNRIVAIGGFGVLDANDEGLILEKEDFPEELKPVLLEHLTALHLLQNSNLDWTFVCPATIINEDYDGLYVSCESYLPENDLGKVGSGNLANYLINCIEKNENIKKKVGITNTQ